MNVILVLVIYFTIQITTQSQLKPKINITSTTNTSSTTVANNISVTPTEGSEDDTLTVSVTTETLFTTPCEDNSSCFVSTENPESNSSVTLKNDSRNRDTLYQQGRYNYKTSTGIDLCTCNLQRNFCDINCCCDEDCSIDDKSIFNHCEPENFYYDTRYCDYMKYIYINNTPFQWHVNQNGLFCILKSNLPPSYTVQRKHPLRSIADVEFEKMNNFSWQRNFERKELSFNPTEPFVYGNNVWMVYKSEIKRFQLPKNFVSNACIIKEDVMNFKNIKNVCGQTDVSEENKALSFSTYFQNVSIIAAPNLVNFSEYKNFFLECPRNICMPLFPKICEKDFSNCKNITKNSTYLDVKCIFDIRNNKNHCKNVVKKLQYNFYHNSTKGYVKIEVTAILEDISYEFEMDTFEYYQEFIVQFWWTNQTTNFSAMLSGNPGYLVGKPVLIGHLINKGNETNVSLKVERFSNDYIRTFLTLPENVNGRCVLNRTAYTGVEFGYNILSTCKFSGIIVNRKKYLNGSEICKNIQKTILNLWGISEKNKTIGMFGNADANNPKDWIKILYKVSPQELLKNTLGKFNSANTTLTCIGLATNLVIDIYHSRIDFEQLLNQEKLLAVTYTFGDLVNTSFIYNKKKNNTYFELILENQVVFYDISRQKQKKFVDPPSLEIKLPYDFFYPFVKIENSVNIAEANFIFSLCLCFFVALI